MGKQWRTWIFFSCLSSLAAPAQASGAAQQSPVPDPQLITLYVVASDKSGQAISGLTEQDFTLLDNKRPQKLSSFRAVEGTTADLPVEVILLVDEVNDSLANVAYAKEQVAKLLRSNGGKLPLPTSLVFFSDSGATIGNKSSLDGNALLAELNADRTPLHAIFQSQDVYGANERFELSLRAIEQLTQAEAKRPGRKLLIWISHGWPSFDFEPRDATDQNRRRIFNTVVGLSSRLRDAGITLYNVDPMGTSDSEGLRTVRYKEYSQGLKDSSQARLSNLGLQVLAYQSGGRVLTSSNDIVSEIAACVSDAKAFYVLSFEAAAADGPNDYHSLDIRIDKPGKWAHTCSGCYAQPRQTEPSAISPPASLEADQETAEAQLVQLVVTSLYSDHDDTSLAERLEKIDFTERLSAETLSELQRLGIGPLAFSVLQELREKSTSLSRPPEAPISGRPVPSEEDENQMVGRLVGYAREYVRNLPNFTCDQITKRYTNLAGFTRNRNPRYDERLHYGDTITA
nr:VWA domain-containing protein [Acidobacteriota bacterium]